MGRRQVTSLRGFTIVEMMVVISLILLIISFLLPSFASVRDRARRVKWYSFANGLRANEDYLVYYPMFHKDKKVVTTSTSGAQTKTNLTVVSNMATLDPNSITGVYDVEPEDYDGVAYMGQSLFGLSSAMWTEGRWENKWGLSFSGVGEYLNIPIVVPLTNASTWMWIRTSDPNTGIFSTMASRLSGAHDRDIFLGNSGKVKAKILNNETITGTTNVADDQWHLIVHTYSETNGQRIWVDGKIEATGSKGKSDLTAQTVAHLGYSVDAGSDNYWGMIDEFAMVKKELDASEITGIFNAGFRGRRR